MSSFFKYASPNLMSTRGDNGTFAPVSVPLATSVFEATIPGFSVLSNVLAAWLNIDLSNTIATCFFLFSVASASRYAYKYLLEAVHTWFTASIGIEESDDLFDHVLDWISDQPITTWARRLTAKTRREYPWHLQKVTGRAINFQDPESRFPPLFTPAHGQHWFMHRGRLFWLNRDRRTVQNQRNSWGNTTSDQEVLKIRTLGFSTEPIKALIEECRFQAAEKQCKSTTVKFPHASRASAWSRAGMRASREVGTVYLDHKTKKEVLTDVENFLQRTTRRFYSRRGIPYRRGYLFWGQPGTGKTSLAFAIAGLYGLPLHVVSLSDSALSDQDLSTLFATLPMSCIVLMEDIDTIAVTRKKEAGSKPEDQNDGAGMASSIDAGAPTQKGQFNGRHAKVSGLSLSGLLNALDGVASQEGRILVMTTNAPETLDEALIRPGRIDMEVYFGHLNRQCARTMFETMYAADVDDDSGDDGGETSEKPIQVSSPVGQLSSQFASKLPENKLTPAEVQGYLLRQRNGPEDAVAGFDDWVHETMAAKLKGDKLVQPLESGPQ